MSLIKGAGVLSVGSAISQAIMLLGVILLSRLYSPEQFGIYAVILGVSTILGLASSFRYEMTILLPLQKRLSQLALSLSLLISVGVNLAALAIVAALSLSNVLIAQWLVVPLAALASAVINIGSFLQNRQKQYKRIVGVQISKSAVFVGAAIFASRSEPMGNGLVFAMLASLLLPAIYLLLVDFRSYRAYEFLTNRRRLLFWARKHRKFVYYSTPAIFIGNLASQAPVFLLTALLGSGTAGYYAMIQRVMMAPVALVSGAVNKVYLQSVASKIAGRKRIFPYTKSIIMKFTLPSLILAGVMVLAFSNELLRRLFGDQWGGVDTLAMVMIPAFCISFVAKSISGFAVLGRNELGLLYQIVLLVAVSTAILTSSYFSSSSFVVFSSISVALSLCFCGQSLAVLRVSQNLDKSV